MIMCPEHGYSRCTCIGDSFFGSMGKYLAIAMVLVAIPFTVAVLWVTIYSVFFGPHYG